MIQTNSLEVFKQNVYTQHQLGLVSNNAYLSIVTTNKCQRKCSYCINSETDQTLELPVDKAVKNIKALVDKYHVKEAIMLGGEPTLHSDLFGLIKKLRTETGLEFLRLTTNGIVLKNNPEFIKQLVHKDFGIQGLNISFHNIDFITTTELQEICDWVRKYNSNIKIRINLNIWKDNNDTLVDLLWRLELISFVDEVRVSNLIPKDSFSVNPKNDIFIGLAETEYNALFTNLCDWYSKKITLIENKETLGFVRYILIPTKCPIIINWNIGSTVAKQVCENDITQRKINTFKCLVGGDISLSWNENNILTNINT
jgi:MoaA/NifB/PqqE/SkfB family radical SAM enzyme